MKTTCDVKELVTVSLAEIFEGGGFEAFLDLIAKKAGHELLQDIDYKIVGIAGETTIQLEVTGCVEVENDDGEEPAAET